MSLEQNLFSTLGSLVGNRVAPVVFPQPPAVPTWPAIRYTISVNAIIDQCGAGDSDTGDARVQLDFVAQTFDAARALRDQGKERMESFDPPAIWEFESSEYDEETRTFREIVQYSIHGSSLEDEAAELREDGGYELRE